MKQASDSKQSLELRLLNDFPEPDLVMEYFWAATDHPYHMIQDEKQIRKHEDVDIIPAWSLGRMIEGLPGYICYAPDEDEFNTLQYNLLLRPQSEVSIAEVIYGDEDDNLYMTESSELLDAVFKMIMLLKENGWYKK